MPDKKSIFTPSSILFRPHHHPAAADWHFAGPEGRIMVEAPGTAPGSEWFIASLVYCHSCVSSTPYIGTRMGFEKARDRDGLLTVTARLRNMHSLHFDSSMLPGWRTVYKGDET